MSNSDGVISEAINVAMNVYNIQCSEIYADESFNCRGYIPPSDCIDLAKEIEQHTLLQPITIQPYTLNPGKKYRIIQGHRRFTAIDKILHWETIPCMIKEGLSETEALILNLGENLQRKALNILQEAKAVERMKNAGMTQTDVADQLRVQRPWVQTRFYVLDFPPDIQDEIAKGTLSQPQIHEVHALPRDQWYEAVRMIKDARIRAGGRKINVSIKKLGKAKPENMLKAKARKVDEINVLLDHMMDTGIPGLHTRVLAWATGQIDTLTLLKEYRTFCNENDIPYHIPSEGIPGI